MKSTRPTNYLMKDIPDFDRISNTWFALYKKPITLPEAREIQQLWNRVLQETIQPKTKQLF